ncbi:MAG: DUF2069 domain-containing protein [Wenzhouxiangellaceae bacterium]|nr:DUF2069 domain-containing protein [Wenzhouxiangellaceae bacterium]
MITLAWTRWLWLALIALQLAWFGVLVPPQQIPIAVMLAVTVIPLLLPVWWVWRLRTGGLVIGGLLLLLYFCLAVAEAWVNPDARAAALVQIVLITLFFVGLFQGWRAARAGSE